MNNKDELDVLCEELVDELNLDNEDQIIDMINNDMIDADLNYKNDDMVFPKQLVNTEHIEAQELILQCIIDSISSFEQTIYNIFIKLEEKDMLCDMSDVIYKTIILVHEDTSNNIYKSLSNGNDLMMLFYKKLSTLTRVGIFYNLKIVIELCLDLHMMMNRKTFDTSSLENYNKSVTNELNNQIKYLPVLEVLSNINFDSEYNTDNLKILADDEKAFDYSISIDEKNTE
jgi:hypothetical protein